MFDNVEELLADAVRWIDVRFALLACLAACSSAQPRAPAVVQHHVPASPPERMAPVIDVPPADPACHLSWDELTEAAPGVIPLAPQNAERSDDCPADFDPAVGCGSAECDRGEMRGHTRAVLARLGPEGSGRFEWLGLVVGEDHRFACAMASTVGWRYLAEVGDRLAPLRWLADVDGDRDAELVLWERLPWGDAEVTNALVPVVYVLDGDRLVRRDDRAHALRAKVGAAYAALASRPTADDGEDHACFVTLSRVLR